MNPYFPLIIFTTIIFTIVIASSDTQTELVNFLKDGINGQISPCDDFYDYLCDKHSSPGFSQVQLKLYKTLMNAVQEDELYPDIAKSFMTHFANCEKLERNESYLFEVMDKYLNSFGFSKPFFSNQSTSDTNYFEALLKIVFLSPTIFPSPGFYSPIEFKYYFIPENNTLAFYASSGISFNALPQEDRKFNDFMGYFNSSWKIYQNLLTRYYKDSPEYCNSTNEYDEVTEFVFEYLKIIARSGKKYSHLYEQSMIKLHNLKNMDLQKAIRKLVPNYIDETINMGNLNISVDEDMIEELQLLFESKPRQSQHFILSMAVLTISYSINLETLGNDGSIMNIPKYCYSYILNPRKGGAIFNLYLADLAIRNNFSMTSVDDQLKVRYLIEKIQGAINSSLIETTWLKGKRELLAALELLFKVTKTVGLPEDIYKSDRFATELAQFSGFYPDDDFFDQIIKLRSSNFRLLNRMLASRDTYFQFFSSLDFLSNDLRLPLMVMQAPFYDSSYPLSYNLGMTGATIGHELFHLFTPPLLYIQPPFNESLECFRNFYTKKMCFIFSSSNNTSEKISICAGQYKDPLQENVPDIEGLRVAYRVLREAYGTKLKTIAIPQLNLTHEQLFFVATGRLFCDQALKKKEDNVRKFAYELIDPDPHGVGRVRVNSMAMHVPEFASAFHCKPNDTMVLPEEERCYLLSKAAF